MAEAATGVASLSPARGARTPGSAGRRAASPHQMEPHATPRSYQRREKGTPPVKQVQSFGSTVERFRAGDMMSPSGIPLINNTRRRDELDSSHAARDGGCGSPPRSGPGRYASASVRSRSNPCGGNGAGTPHSHPPRPANSIQALRARHPRPTRWALDSSEDPHAVDDAPPSCVGRAVCQAAVLCVAESTIWCAERNGTITIREKDGTVFAVVDREPDAPVITAMLFVPSTFKGSRMLLGHDDGSVLSLNAATAERCGDYVPMVGAAVSCLDAVHQGQPATLAVCADADGEMCVFDVCSMTKQSAPMQHAGAVTACAPLGAHVCTACEDGTVRKWDIHSAAVVSSLPLDAPIVDLLSSGRYLWAVLPSACRVAVIDSLTMKVDAALDPPSASPPVRLLFVGQHCWIVHEDGAIHVYNSQTLELTRSVAPSAASQEPLVTAHKVVTVPEDHEVWTLTRDGFVHMWRSSEYSLPVWCAEAYQAWGDDVRQAQDEANRLQHALSVKDERIAALEAAHERVREDAAEHQQLLQSLEELVEVKNAELDRESERRKRAETELGELRQAVIHAHKTLAPPVRHLLHYKHNDVKGVVGWLSTEAQRAEELEAQTAASGEAYETLRGMIECAHKDLIPDDPPAGFGEEGTMDALSTIVANAQSNLLSKDGDPKASPAVPHVTPPEAAVVPPSSSTGGAAPGDAAPGGAVEELETQNSTLERDNQRLKDMLEKLKASHRTVNQQLQAFVQQQADVAHLPPAHTPGVYDR
eukprot:TRINITY_DN30706_c0_g1_i1.p1 TRINITY_DN30706_c0_g1~~TRINITY_DN30706_c0_g1_i1.p1  ORF type:complete len:776 (+),score=245.06 TRINITY_DN30706_c0_g1_i1:52-2328(+)